MRLYSKSEILNERPHEFSSKKSDQSDEEGEEDFGYDFSDVAIGDI